MRKLPVKDLTAFAMMGALMFVSTLLMKALPEYSSAGCVHHFVYQSV